MPDLQDFPAELIGQPFKERYPAQCLYCKWEGQARPSLFMSMGINQGSIVCRECQKVTIVCIDDKNERMIPAPFQIDGIALEHFQTEQSSNRATE